MRSLASRPTHGKRLIALGLILLLGFGLRLATLPDHDANIDETFSFFHASYLTHSGNLPGADVPGYYALAYEPNNALHLLLSGLFMSAVPSVLGLRWISLLAGMVSLAALARIAHRLFHDDALTVTATLVAALAYTPILYAQLGRPYPLANCFGLLSLLFWLENRWKSNMVAGMLTAFSHAGAMPLIFVQDALALWTIARRKPLRWWPWIVSRIGIYGSFLLVLGLVHLRRLSGKIISGGESGQTLPSARDLLDNFITALHGPLANIDLTAPHTLLFLLGVAAPALIVLGVRAARRQLPANTAIPVLWLAVTYLTLAFMAVVGDGPLKFIHIMHVAFAYALLLAVALIRAPRLVGVAMLVCLVAANAVTLLDHYTHPYHPYSEAMVDLESVTSPGESVYYQNESPVLALTLNHPPGDFLRPLPDAREAWPETFRYLAYRDWPPPLPSGCDPTPVWTHGDYHVHACTRAGTG